MAVDNVTLITSDTVLTAVDRVVLIDSTSNPVTATLPNVHLAGERHSIKDYGNTGLGYSDINPVYVDPGPDKIDGESGPRLLELNEGLNLLSNGSDWGTVV